MKEIYIFRRIWAKPLKNKTADSVLTALKDVVDEGIRIQTFATDFGKEYLNEKFKKFLKDNEIRWAGKVG
jgi:hypothetical protein